MRSDRVLSLLMLLQSYGRLPASELARRLEVSTRTIYRDVEALSAAGVPVYAERGRSGGCALVPGYRTDMTGLSTDEARALFAFSDSDGGTSPGLQSAFRSALRKLLAALPDTQRPSVDHTAQRVLVEACGWNRTTDDLTHLPAIERAVWTDRRLAIGYRHADRTEATYHLDPYGLVRKAGIWYLIAAESSVLAGSDGPSDSAGPSGSAGPSDSESVGSDRARMFRVSRVLSVEVLADRADRPPDLDLEGLWRSLSARIPGPTDVVEARLAVRASMVDRVLRLARWQLLDDPVVEDPGAGADPGMADWVYVGARFKGLVPARGVLLGFGADVQVLSPPELRDELTRAAAEVVALYR